MSRKQKDAAVAQSVVRRIGSAEVTGPIPVSSSARKERKPLIYKGFRFFYSLLAIHSSCAIMITVWTGTYLSWESVAFATQRSRVRIPLSP